jgi:hypothetical protein
MLLSLLLSLATPTKLKSKVVESLRSMDARIYVGMRIKECRKDEYEGGQVMRMGGENVGSRALRV